MSSQDLENEITVLSDKWRLTEDINDPFIQHYLDNPLAVFLEAQKELIPDRYGEIFITDHSGIVVATTNKLTTINHAHKYWWVAAYDQGEGKLFLDDRGFDPSADGYVLGIVHPIVSNNEIIGIIKANINIQSMLEDISSRTEFIHGDTHISIIRSKGLVIYQKGVEPLSKQVSSYLVDLMQQSDSTFDDYEGMLGAFKRVPFTIGNETTLFGGSYESIDHILGNEGEGWHILSTINKESLYTETNKNMKELILIGFILAVVVAFIAMVIGKQFSKPLVDISEMAEHIGQGDFEERIEISSHDEIGQLAQTFNNMATELQSTMAEKNLEVSKRIQAEEESHYQSIHDFLTGLYNRRYVEEYLRDTDLSDLYPITFVIGDVNGLKVINDTISHFAGDELLQRVATSIKSKLYGQHILARWGGDEFVIVLFNTDQEEASKIIDSIDIIGKETFENIDVGIAFGSHTNTKSDERWEFALSEAEIQMYQNKIATSNISRKDIIDTIISAYNEKSPNESIHSTHVSEWCYKIGKTMDFSSEEINRLRLAGLLHDIGKIGIRDELLTQSDIYSDEERSIINGHAFIGYRILNATPSFRDIALWVWCHHERIDGSGYPRGIKGERIPIFSRIISVADSYDAMTSWRAYKDILTPDAAIKELRRCSGTQFDSKIVEIFIEEVLKKEKTL
jgi:diguanylate cyclase (GGDEF)-like protein